MKKNCDFLAFQDIRLRDLNNAAPVKKEQKQRLGVFCKKRPATLLKERLWCRCFPVNFAKFLRSLFLQKTSGRLLLKYFAIITILS